MICGAFTIVCILGVQQQLTAFSSYRTQEKPGKFEEKGNLEVLLFTLQSKMRANNQKPYTPKEGKLVSDINKVQGRRSNWLNFSMGIFDLALLVPQYGINHLQSLTKSSQLHRLSQIPLLY